jgi:acyl-CoA synthetase (AMP-forming)/AMP-acid ligase II
VARVVAMGGMSSYRLRKQHSKWPDISSWEAADTSARTNDTIPKRLLHLANTFPDKEVFMFLAADGVRHAVTCKDLYTNSKHVACALIRTLGVQTGDVVVVAVSNSPECCIVTMVLSWRARECVQLNTCLTLLPSSTH